MARWFNPLLFFGVAGYVWWFNGTHDDRTLTLPFIEAFVGNDRRAMGDASWKVAAAIGAIFLVWGVVGAIRERRQAAPTR